MEERAQQAAQDTGFTNPATDATAEAADYVRRLLELLGDRDPLEVQRELVPWLRKEVAGLPDAVLRRPERPGKWSIMEVVRHLADTELVHRYRMRMSVAQPESPIAGYDQDLWAERLGYRDDPLEDALRELEALREANLAWIAGLSEEELDRWGLHAERGRESVRDILKLLAAHDLVHRRQILRIRDAVA